MRGGATIVGVSSEDPGPSGIVDRVYAAILSRTHVAFSGCTRLLPPRCVVCGLQPGAASTSICAAVRIRLFCRRNCALRALRDTHTGRPNPARRASAGAAWPIRRTSIQRSTLADYVSPVDGMVMALKFTARLDLAQFFGQLLASRSAAMPPSAQRWRCHPGAARVRAHASARIQSIAPHRACFRVGRRPPSHRRSIASRPTHRATTNSRAE